MSDETLAILLPAITTIAVSVVLPLCMAGLALLQWWLSKKQETAAKNAEAAAQSAEVKVQQVKNDLRDANYKANLKTDAIAEVLNDVHDLTNSAMGLALKSNAALARWKADQTKGQKDWQENESAAAVAELALIDHKAKQKVVDSRKESP